MVDARGVTCYTYDTRDRLELVRELGVGGVYGQTALLRQIRYSYDADDNRTGISVTVGGTSWTQGYAYDSLGRICVAHPSRVPSSCTDTSGGYVYAYDDPARTQTITYPSGVVETQIYDQRMHLSLQRYSYQAAVLRSFTYDTYPDGTRWRALSRMARRPNGGMMLPTVSRASCAKTEQAWRNGISRSPMTTWATGWR